MKIRNDFVTNSSSSSFIIAVKQDTEGQMKDFIKSMFSSEGHKTVEELTEFYLWNWGYDTIEEIEKDCPSIYDVYQDCVKAINEGMMIVTEEADYASEEGTRRLASALSDAGAGRLIHEEY